MKRASCLMASTIKKSVRTSFNRTIQKLQCFSTISFDPYAPKHKEHAHHVETLQAARREAFDKSNSEFEKQSNNQSNNQSVSQSYQANQSNNQSHQTNQSNNQSNNQNDNQSHEDDLRTQILDLALSKVPEYGWTMEAISQAIKQSNLSIGLVGLFQNGPYDMVIHHHNKSTDKSINQLMSLPLDEMSLNDRLIAGMVNQLNNQSIYHSSLPQMIGLSLVPSNLPTTLQLIAEYIDRLWYVCGDQSINHEYYLKRASIISVYSTSCLYLSTDQSNNHQQTIDFLIRSMKDLDDLRNATQSINQSVNQYSSMLFSMLDQAGNSRK